MDTIKAEFNHQSLTEYVYCRTSKSARSSKDCQMDNWTLLKEVWPVEQRPESLRSKRTFNATSMDTLTAVFKIHSEKQRVENEEGMADEIDKDGKYPTLSYEKASDNRVNIFHKASFVRAPLAEPAAYAEELPTKLKPVVRAIPLHFLGAQNAISLKTVEMMHNRCRAMKLKHFHSANMSVTSKGKVEVTKSVGNEQKRSTEFDWESPVSLQNCYEALCNYKTVLGQLFPWDSTGNIMERVLVKYKYVSSAEELSTRKNIIIDFFDAVMKSNAIRATNSAPYFNFDEMEAQLKDSMVRFGVQPMVPIPKVFPKQGQSGNRGGQSGGQRGSGRGENRAKYPPAAVGGVLLCYNYNSLSGKRCSNLATKDGCKDNTGKAFLHLCNKYVSEKGSYCFQKHPKSLHR